jgi:hypothetical protein
MLEDLADDCGRELDWMGKWEAGASCGFMAKPALPVQRRISAVFFLEIMMDALRSVTLVRRDASHGSLEMPRDEGADAMRPRRRRRRQSVAIG